MEERRRIRNFDRLGGAGVLNNFVRRLKKEVLLLGANRAAPSTGKGEQRDEQVMAGRLQLLMQEHLQEG